LGNFRPEFSPLFQLVKKLIVEKITKLAYKILNKKEQIVFSVAFFKFL